MAIQKYLSRKFQFSEDMTQIYKRNVALQKRLDEIKERKETVMKLGPKSHAPPLTFIRV